MQNQNLFAEGHWEVMDETAADGSKSRLATKEKHRNRTLYKCCHFGALRRPINIDRVWSPDIIRHVGKDGKLGRDGQHYQLERHRKLQQVHALRMLEQMLHNGLLKRY